MLLVVTVEVLKLLVMEFQVDQVVRLMNRIRPTTKYGAERLRLWNWFNRSVLSVKVR